MSAVRMSALSRARAYEGALLFVTGISFEHAQVEIGTY
jgi:hypothetical protein